MSDTSDMNEQPPADRHEHHAYFRRPRAWFRPVFLLIFAVVIAAIAFTGETLGHSRRAGAATISVTGSGTVTGTPNTMSFQIGFQSTSPSAVAALAQNNAKVAAMEATLLRYGIVKKNLQTSGLDIYENTNDHGQVTGFTVDDELNVTTHVLSKAGAAIDAAARVAGNGIEFNGVTFSISNQSTLLAAARARAIANAHTEAVQIAKGGDTTVGSILKVTDQENTGSTGIVYPEDLSYRAAAAAVPIQQGSQQINVQVSVTYALAS